MYLYSPDLPATRPASPPLPVLSGGGLRIGLISNRHSRRNLKTLARVDEIITAYPNLIHRLVHTPDDIAAALQELARQPLDVLAVNGGDGTVAATLTCLFRHRPFEAIPPLALLPGGTTNMTAADCGLRGSLTRALRRLCTWADTGDPPCTLIQRPVLRVTAGSDHSPLYGMFFGAGTIIQGIEYCHAHLHSIGVGDELGPGLTALRTLWGILRRDPRFATPVTVAVGLDGPPSPDTQKVMILLISTLERLFLGIRPYWGEESGPLHYSAVRDGAEHLLRVFPSLLRGRPNPYGTPQAGYASHDATEIQLTMEATYTLDGELYQARRKNGPLVVTEGGRVTFVRL